MVIRIQIFPIINAETKLRLHHTANRAVHILFFQNAKLICLACRLLYHTRIVRHGIHTGFQRRCDRLRMLSEIVMQIHDKSHRTAVADNVTETVLFFQNIGHFRIQDTDRSVDLVICRHNALCAAILNTSAEWLQIQLIFVPRVNGRIFPSAADLRVVSIEML